MQACCQGSSPTTFQDTLVPQTSSCLPHLCIYEAPAKIHRLWKLPLNHFPAPAPIIGIEVVRSKRKGMQSILFACHQCHFAARQLERGTHRQELLAAGESMARKPDSCEISLAGRMFHRATPSRSGYAQTTPKRPLLKKPEA